MDVQLSFVESRGRGVTALDRGWRTPDPSPTRDAAFLPACAPKELIQMMSMMPAKQGLDLRNVADESGYKSPNPWDADTPRGNFQDMSDEASTPRGNFVNAPYARELDPLLAPASPCSTPRGNFANAPYARELDQPPLLSPPGYFAMPFPVQMTASPHMNSGPFSRSVSIADALDAPVPMREPSPKYQTDTVLPKPPLPYGVCDSGGNFEPPSRLKSDARNRKKAKAPSYTVSIGSVGHPHSCAEACKFIRKQRGCKDGHNCDRCHLCTWIRPREPRPLKGLASGTQ